MKKIISFLLAFACGSSLVFAVSNDTVIAEAQANAVTADEKTSFVKKHKMALWIVVGATLVTGCLLGTAWAKGCFDTKEKSEDLRTSLKNLEQFIQAVENIEQMNNGEKYKSRFTPKEKIIIQKAAALCSAKVDFFAKTINRMININLTAKEKRTLRDMFAILSKKYWVTIEEMLRFRELCADLEK